MSQVKRWNSAVSLDSPDSLIAHRLLSANSAERAIVNQVNQASQVKRSHSAVSLDSRDSLIAHRLLSANSAEQAIVNQVNQVSQVKRRSASHAIPYAKVKQRRNLTDCSCAAYN